jgi:hypothetical protein
VIAGEHVDRHRQGLEQFADTLVLGRARIGDQVAADQDGFGLGGHRQHRVHRGRQRASRAGVARADGDVRVAELSEEGQTFFTWS